MSKWGKPTKNRKRIDPRYFLNETTNRDLKEYSMEPPMAGEPPPRPDAGGTADLASEVQRLYDEWQPQTDEGRRYRDDLGEVIGISATDPGPSPDYPPAHEFE